MIGKKDKFLRLSKSIISSKEIFAVKNILKRGFLGMGPEVKKFENNLMDYLGRDVVCFNSGTVLYKFLYKLVVLVKDTKF